MADSFLLFDNVTKDKVSNNLFTLFTDKVLPKLWDNDEPAQFPAESRVYAFVSDEHAPMVIEAAIQG